MLITYLKRICKTATMITILWKSFPSHVKDIRRLVTLSTKLSHAYNDYASHAYEDDSKNTTSANKERPHHQDPDSDEDVIALLSTHGNNKMPPFYPLLRGRSEDAPSVTNDPKSNIMELATACNRWWSKECPTIPP